MPFVNPKILCYYIGMKEFGTRLKQLRLAESMSQLDLAEELHVSTSAISLWESGKYYPNKNKLIELAQYFQVSINYLLDCDMPNISAPPALSEGEKSLLKKFHSLPRDKQKIIWDMINLYRSQE